MGLPGRLPWRRSRCLLCAGSLAGSPTGSKLARSKRRPGRERLELRRVVLLGAAMAPGLLLPRPAVASGGRPTPVVNVTVGGATGRTQPAPGAPVGGWQGIGINWDGVPYQKAGGKVVKGIHGLGNPFLWSVLPWSDDKGQLALDEARLVQLHPAFVRMSWAANWFDPTAQVGRYDWSSNAMKDTVIDLQFLQRNHIPVIASMWSPPGSYMTYGSPSWTALQVALVSHLVKAEGFTNVRYFLPVNEPTQQRCRLGNCPIPMATWRRATEQLHQALLQAGLGASVPLVGPTVSTQPPWNSWPARHGGVPHWPRRLAGSPAIHVLGAVDWHEYIWTDKAGDPPSGADALRAVQRVPVRAYTARIARSVRSQPDTAHQKTMVSEFGFAGISMSTDDGVPSFDYALALLTFGVQLARSGINAAAVWELDPDVVHFGIASDGLWRSAPPFTTYPLYEAVELMIRAAPPGAFIEPVASSNPSVAALATLQPAAAGGAWTVLVVNDSARSAAVRLEGLPKGSTLRQLSFSARSGHWSAALRLSSPLGRVNGPVTKELPGKGALLLSAS